MKKIMEFQHRSKNLIIFETNSSVHYGHFVHYMQYLYWCIDIIINCNNSSYKYIIVEPINKSNGRYVKSFLKKILDKVKNIELISMDTYSGIYPSTIYKKYKFVPWPTLKGNFNLNDNIVSCDINNWFPKNKSNIMRNLFFKPKETSLKIGLVNRKQTKKNNRVILNSNELCDTIKEKFNISVDIAFFEDKSFTYQTEFFNDHKIIISPHGAQLCSIPFTQDDSLIIECAHEEWHPYEYFTGLSVTSNKYHYMICDDHSAFPAMWGDKYIVPARGRSNNSRLNITVNVEKVINIIDNYLKNNNKLQNYNCNLV